MASKTAKKKSGKAAAPATRRGYPDLHDHIEALKRAGLLIVVDRKINKDTEMHPLVRWQFRGGVPEEDRKAFLFTNITDSMGRKFDIPVLVGGLAGIVGGEEIAVGLRDGRRVCLQHHLEATAEILERERASGAGGLDGGIEGLAAHVFVSSPGNGSPRSASTVAYTSSASTTTGMPP